MRRCPKRCDLTEKVMVGFNAHFFNVLNMPGLGWSSRMLRAAS
jgi:hypothetical protein